MRVHTRGLERQQLARHGLLSPVPTASRRRRRPRPRPCSPPRTRSSGRRPGERAKRACAGGGRQVWTGRQAGAIKPHTHRLEPRSPPSPLEKALLIGCARLWAATATATSGTRGACVVSADQAPRRARSMGARGSGIFNGVTQSASLFAFQSLRHATLCISTSLFAFQEPLARHSLRLGCSGLPVICS